MDAQPLDESNLYMFSYFVIFIILGVFVCANLIVGILVKHILNAGNLSVEFNSSKKPKPEVTHSNRSNGNDVLAQDVSVNLTFPIQSFSNRKWFFFSFH